MSDPDHDQQAAWPSVLGILAGSIRDADRFFPEGPRRDGYAQLVLRVAQTVCDDPVVRSIEGRYPALSGIYGPMTTGEVPTSEPFRAAIGFIEAASADEQLRDVVGTWAERVERVAEPIVTGYVESKEFLALLVAAASQMAPETVEDVQRRIGPGLANWVASDVGRSVQAHTLNALDSMATPEHVGTLREMIRFIIDAALEGSSLWLVHQHFRSLADDALHEDNLDRGKDLLRWHMDNLFRPQNSLVLQVVARRVIASLCSDAHRDARTMAVVVLLQRVFEARLAMLRGAHVDPDDVNLLSVTEAAAYLGIRPYSLHAHIRRRSGTKAAVPATLRKASRGKGTYVIPLNKLAKWEE
ncbi:hypothetical protein HOK31_17480, partial [Candidatus Poribacteria bacterium]|nr:hypothetical protein [Candidatus Poribacteria bacterium]